MRVSSVATRIPSCAVIRENPSDPIHLSQFQWSRRISWPPVQKTRQIVNANHEKIYACCNPKALPKTLSLLLRLFRSMTIPSVITTAMGKINERKIKVTGTNVEFGISIPTHPSPDLLSPAKLYQSHLSVHFLQSRKVMKGASKSPPILYILFSSHRITECPRPHSAKQRKFAARRSHCPRDCLSLDRTYTHAAGTQSACPR